MENTTQILVVDALSNQLDSLKRSLKALKNVEAELSTNTYNNVSACLKMAERALEEGFLKDSCDSVDKVLYN